MDLGERVEEFLYLYWEARWADARVLVTDDFRWINLAWEGQEHAQRGWDGIIELTEDFMSKIDPGSGYSAVPRSITDANVVAHERVDIWASDGLWYHAPCGGFWTFRDGLIESWRDYWDVVTMDNWSERRVEGRKMPWAPRPPVPAGR